MHDLKRFEADLRAHEDLRAKFDEILKRIKDEGTVASDGEAFAAAAKTLGYEFTTTALEQSRAMAEELDMEELEKVTGGEQHLGKPEHCYVAWEGAYTDGDGHDWWC